MAVLPRGLAAPGNQVVLAAQNLPQTATATLFTVSGGTVLVQFLAGLVTTALGATVTTLSLGNTPTGGSAANTSIATAGTVTSKPVGTLFVPTWASGVGSTPVIVSAIQYQAGSVQSFLVPAGTITWTSSANDTGQMKWFCSWLPIDSGASLS
jgi:hypothetical protein